MSDILSIIGPLLKINVREFLNGSGLQTLGSRKVEHETYYLSLMGPAIFLIVLLSFTQKRRSFRPDVFNGRPGLVYPLNFLGRSKRFIYASSFGAITYLCIRILIMQQYVIDYNGPAALKVFVMVFSVLVYGIDFYPLFASLAVDSFIGYIIGSLYSLALTIVFFIQTFAYDTEYTIDTLWLGILYSLPMLLCLIFTTIAFPVRMVRFYRTKWKNKTDRKSCLEKIRNSYHGRYVRRIIQKQNAPQLEENKNVWQRGLAFVRNMLYTSVPDFRFSTRIVYVMVMGLISLYVLTTGLLMFFVIWINKSKEILDTSNNIDISVKDVLIKGLDVFKECLIVSSIFPFLLGIVNILHFLSSFRSDLLSQYKGIKGNIPRPSVEPMQNSFWLAASMRYGGYQIAYIGWAYVIQTTTFFLFTIFCALLVHFDIFREWLIQSLLQLLPTLFMILIIMGLQLVLSRWLFLQNKARTLAIDNRRGYFVFAYFMFFYNMFFGIVSCILRILKALVIGLFFLSRLDKSILPERFQFLDPGYKSYMGFMCVEACHTNPVMITFVKLLTLPFVSTKEVLPTDENRRMTLKYLVKSIFDYQEMEEAQYGQPCKRSSKIATRRWHLFYTLLKNPQLQSLRKKNITVESDIQVLFM